MSLYHIVFICLLFGAIIEYIAKKSCLWVSLPTYLFLTAMLCLRFGQGQDYFSYASVYYSLPSDLSALFSSEIHSEVGWKFLCVVARKISLPFPFFVALLSIYLMLVFGRFLFMYCKERPMFAMLLCFHTLYLSYFMTSLRQSVVVITFLGILLPWLTKHHYVKYCLVSFLLCFIHTVAIILLIAPLMIKFKSNPKHLVSFVAICFALGIVLSAIDIGVLLSRIISIPYLGKTKVSFLAIMERIITFAAVTTGYVYSQKHKKLCPTLSLVFQIYAIGICLYGLTMWSALIASRVTFIFKMLEVILLCHCIPRSKKLGAMLLVYCTLLSSLMYVKNIDSYLEQGNYKNATFLTYPYVTIFNQEDILEYRTDTLGYPFN